MYVNPPLPLLHTVYLKRKSGFGTAMNTSLIQVFRFPRWHSLKWMAYSVTFLEKSLNLYKVQKNISCSCFQSWWKKKQSKQNTNVLYVRVSVGSLHDRTGLGFALEQTWHGIMLRSTGHVRRSLGGSGRLVTLHVLAALVDAGQSSHVENVSHAVLRLQRRTLDVRSGDLLGHVWALRQKNEN